MKLMEKKKILEPRGSVGKKIGIQCLKEIC